MQSVFLKVKPEDYKLPETGFGAGLDVVEFTDEYISKNEIGIEYRYLYISKNNNGGGQRVEEYLADNYFAIRFARNPNRVSVFRIICEVL